MAGMRAGRWGVVRRRRECGRRWVVMVQSGGMATLVNFKSAITTLGDLAAGDWCEIATRPGLVFLMSKPDAGMGDADVEVYGLGHDGTSTPLARHLHCVKIPPPVIDSVVTVTFS